MKKLLWLLLLASTITSTSINAQERTAGSIVNPSDSNNSVSAKKLSNSTEELNSKVNSIIACQRLGQFFNSTTGACEPLDEVDPFFTSYKDSIPVCDFLGKGEINTWDGDKWICDSVPEPPVPETYCYSGPNGQIPSTRFSSNNGPKHWDYRYRDDPGQGGGCSWRFQQYGNCYTPSNGHYYNKCYDSRGCMMKANKNASWTKVPNGTEYRVGVVGPGCGITWY